MRAVGLLGLFVVYAPIHVATKLLFGRSNWPRRFLAAAARDVGLRVRVLGEPLQPHSLVIANHLSWLDILVLGGHAGCAFVAKDNLGHGLIHWLADQNHTIYVRRESRHAAKDQAMAIAAALEREQPVAIFPEGTTGPGTEMLPFRSTLLEAAALASKDVAIRPVAIDYGPATAEIAWWQEPGWHYIKRVLGRRGTADVTVTLLAPLRHSGDRKALAQAAREAIAETLASSRRGTPL